LWSKGHNQNKKLEKLNTHWSMTAASQHEATIPPTQYLSAGGPFLIFISGSLRWWLAEATQFP